MTFVTNKFIYFTNRNFINMLINVYWATNNSQ